ncbi:MAG TPA: helix-turn-helix domain-containing protein [Solirubrobacteraceae bacterium]|jgi:cytoskeletal protein RodZ
MADIGATLREARMRAKIDINEVETRTKIRAKYLRAIENEEWGLLPGDVYVKSFLRTYSEYLGLDSRQLLDDYKRRYERPSDHELKPITPLGRERERQRQPRGPLIPPWVLIGVVLVGVVVALYFLGVKKNGENSTTTGTHAQTTTPKKPAKHRATHHTRTVASTVKLQLTPTGAVYVCLVDGKGKRLIPGQIFNVGQSIPVKTASKLLLTLGNASVKMKVNGVAVTVPATGSPVGFDLTPGSHTMLPAAKQPQCA